MNKKLLILITGLFLILLTGCGGQDGKYEKLMAKAEKAMEDFKIDEALKHYNEILAMKPEDLPYGDTRLMIVQSLADSTEALKSQVDELEKETADIKKKYEKLDYSDEKIDQLEEFNSQIAYVLSRLESYPNTSLYKETSEMKKEFDENIESKIVKVLKEGIDKDLEKTLFEDAKEKVEKLNRIQGSFGIEIAGLDDYGKKIEKERSKYISFPYQITERNQVLYDNKDVGKVTFLGEGIKDGKLKAFYKYEGDMRAVAKDVGLQIKYIFSDGEYTQLGNFDYSYYDGYIIAEQTVGDDSVTIQRMDYRFNFMEEEEFGSVEHYDFGMMYEVTFNRQNLLSVVTTISEYWGGVHPIGQKQGAVYNLSTGEELSLKDLLGDNYQEKVNTAVYNGMQTGEYSFITPFTGIEEDPEFYLTDKGIVVFFGLYEYTPYSNGFPEFIIPLEM